MTIRKILVAALGAAALLASTNVASAQDSEPTLEQTIDYIERNCGQGLSVEWGGSTHTNQRGISLTPDRISGTLFSEHRGSEWSETRLTYQAEVRSFRPSNVRSDMNENIDRVYFSCRNRSDCVEVDERWRQADLFGSEISGSESDTKSSFFMVCTNPRRVVSAWNHFSDLVNGDYSDDMFAPAN